MAGKEKERGGTETNSRREMGMGRCFNCGRQDIITIVCPHNNEEYCSSCHTREAMCEQAIARRKSPEREMEWRWHNHGLERIFRP